MTTDSQTWLGVCIVLAMFAPALVVLLFTHPQVESTMLKFFHLLQHRLAGRITINPNKIRWEGSREFGKKFALYPDYPKTPVALLIWDTNNHDLAYVTNETEALIREFDDLLNEEMDFWINYPA